MKYLIFLILFLGIATVVFPQAPIETKNWSNAMESFAVINRFERADSIFFCPGSKGFVKSGVFQFWKFTTVSFRVTGTSPNLKFRFYNGWAPKYFAIYADTTKFHFTCKDSLTVTSSGDYNHQISDAMDGMPFFYMSIEALGGCGSDVLVIDPWTYRNRY